MLCLVIDGVSHIVVVAVEVLRFRLLARLHAGRISKVQVDGRTRNGFECNIFQLYLLECQHAVGQFHGVAHVFCFRNGNLCRSGKHLELETSLAVRLGRKGLVIPAVQRLRNRNSGTDNRFLALQVYHPTLQLKLRQRLQVNRHCILAVCYRTRRILGLHIEQAELLGQCHSQPDFLSLHHGRQHMLLTEQHAFRIVPG